MPLKFRLTFCRDFDEWLKNITNEDKLSIWELYSQTFTNKRVRYRIISEEQLLAEIETVPIHMALEVKITENYEAHPKFAIDFFDKLNKKVNPGIGWGSGNSYPEVKGFREFVDWKNYEWIEIFHLGYFPEVFEELKKPLLPIKYLEGDMNMGVLLPNCLVTISKKNGAEFISNVKANIQSDRSNSGSYTLTIDIPDVLPEIGDIVQVSNIKLLSGDWEIWNDPIVHDGGPRFERVSHMTIEVMKPERLSAKTKGMTDGNMGHTFNVHGGNVKVGDTNITGHFQNVNFNIDSKLEKVTQSIGSLPNVKQESKEEVTNLLDKLREELKEVPSEKASETEKVIKRIEALVEEAGESEPDKEEIKTRSNSLKKAAENLASVTPTVFNLACEVATVISKWF